MTENQALIVRHYRGKPMHRGGRGFSLSELKEARVSVGSTRRLGIYVDPRRRTRHEANLRLLERILRKSAKNSHIPNGAAQPR